MSTVALPPKHSLSDVADAARARWASSDDEHRAALGQFFTPSVVGRFMASLFAPARRVRLLDPGAGVGSLTAAYVEAALDWRRPPAVIEVVAYEADARLLEGLRATLAACSAACGAAGVAFTSRVVSGDFLAAAAASLEGGLFANGRIDPFDAIIMNPPYRKVHAGSPERAVLRRAGVETSNLYSGFVALAARLLRAGGELVAITPRSFCNGPYFRPFRETFFAEMTLDRAHVFERRDRAFGDDDVLQENVIFHAVRDRRERRHVVVSTSDGPACPAITTRRLRSEEVLDRSDPELVVRLPTGRTHRRVAGRVEGLPCALDDLRLAVSTGRVVDFRAREFLRGLPAPGTVPLIYPETFASGVVVWPKAQGRKPQAIVQCPDTESLLVDAGHYVLVKRFSAKEEPRRIVAAVYDPAVAPGQPAGFENHLNYFHRDGAGIPPATAIGLATFLNSTLVDTYFRQESGHTQVNASDLRRLRYPSLARLDALGRRIGSAQPAQRALDRLVAGMLLR